MPSDGTSPTSTQIEDRLQQVGRYSRFVKVRLGGIVGALLLAVAVLLPENLGSAENAVNAVLLPLIFVGMGLCYSASGCTFISCT